MCNFKSFIVTIDGGVYYSLKHDNHSRLLEELKIEDDTADPELIKFARVEIVPANNVFDENLKDWKLKIDQSIKPKWWGKDLEYKCFLKLKEALDKQVFIGKKNLELRDGLFFLKDSIVEDMRSNSIVEVMRGNSIVKDMWDNSIVEAMGDNSIVKDMRDNSIVEVMYSNSIVEVMRGNSIVEDMRGNSIVEVMWDNSIVKVMWDNSIVKDMWDNSIVKDMRGNSIVEVMRGNSIVEAMRGNSIVKVMRDNSIVEVMRDNSIRREDGLVYLPKGIKSNQHKNKK